MRNNKQQMISEKIKAYRKNNNLTQSDLASILYVSKQAVSRWENNLSLPDISMYPKLSEILGITIDELMGNTVKPKKHHLKHFIIFGILFILLIGEIIVFNVISSKNDEKISIETKFLNEAETELNMKFSNVVAFEYNDFTSWVSYNDLYPNSMYYFIFEDDITKVSNSLVKKLDDSKVMTIPLYVKNYLDTCDYFLLIETENSYRLYCLQIVNKRLIVINYTRK